MRRWRGRALQIPDPGLRCAALDAQHTKRDGVEAAAAFAAFAPPGTRMHVVHAIVAFQVCLDYIDTLGELPSDQPIVNGQTLNQALVLTFEPGVSHPDYYAFHGGADDAGYLEDLVDACRTAVAALPSFAAIATPARRALSQIVSYQSLNHGDADGSYDAFTDWARSQSAPGAGLRWWEVGAAAGSQLSVLALIAAAADPTTRAERAAALEGAYFPWIGALSTLLDSLIDHRSDKLEGQRSLIDHYSSPRETADRLQMMASEALRAIRPLPDAENHTLILAAMAAFFHSTPQAAAPDVGLATHAVLDTMGGIAKPALMVFKARRALARRSLADVDYAGPPNKTPGY